MIERKNQLDMTAVKVTQGEDTQMVSNQPQDCSFNVKHASNGIKTEIMHDMSRVDPHTMAASNTAGGCHPASTLDPGGPLPNEIFELLNEFWRPNEYMPVDGQLAHGNNKTIRRNSSSLSDEAIDEEKGDCDEEVTMIAEQEQDNSQDRNTSKRRYSRLSDGYERLKSVLPSVKDKRRVSKARILDEAINYITRLESITNVLKREHEKRMQLLSGSNGYLTDYGVQPFVRSLFPKQMYQQQMIGKMPQYPKSLMTSQGGSDKSNAARMKAAGYQYANQMPPSLGPTGPMPPDYNGYPPSAMGMNYPTSNGTTNGSLNNNNNNNSNSNSMFGNSDHNQMINGDASPINNTSPYSQCSVSPDQTPNSYQNGASVNNSWPYHQASVNNTFNETSNPSIMSNRQSTPVYNTTAGNSFTNLSPQNGMWSGMPMNDSSSSIAPNGDHALKVV